MKKFFSWMLVAVTALLASCSQEDELYADLGGEELMTIQVGIPASQLATRAGSDAFKDPELSGMRVTLFICKEGKIVSILNESSHDFGSGSTAATFTARLIKGQTYNFVAWCDFGDDYYDLPTSEDMSEEPSATMHSTSVDGSNNKYDAYFGRTDAAITSNDIINVVCRRPFALVKVNTTDWNEDAVKNANLRPNGYETTINVPTTVNLYSGETSAADDVTYTASIVEYDQDGNQKELHYDYILASSTKSTLPDFTVKYDQGGTVITDYTFQNIPVQRNYKTNITGNILTKVGTINVTIDPLWSGTEEVIIKEVATPTAANEDLESNKDETTGKEYVIKTTPENDNTIIIPDGTKAATLTYTLEDLGTNNQITVKDENPGTQANYDNEVTLKVPEVSGEKPTIYVNTQSAHVTVIGDANIVYANTSENTFVVAKESTIETIEVQKGNVALYGTVTSIKRSSNNPDATTTVNLYDGAVWTNWATEKATEKITPIVNVGTYTFDPTGYNIEGSIVTDNSNNTWTVSLDDNWTSYAASSFSNVSGTTITIMSAAELALFAKDYSKYTNYTINLGTYIDLAAHKWVPIASFSGTFDGKGYSISNMSINDDDSKGFFNVLTNATIKNLTLKAATVVSKSNDCGILAGEITAGTITGVKIQKSTLTTTGERVGAIYGIGYPAIDGCEVTGCTITGSEQVGAVAGYMWIGSIQNSKATGNTVTATTTRAGGLVGKMHVGAGNLGSSSMWLKNNVVSGTVSSATDGNAGGLIGQFHGDDARYEISGNSIDVTGADCPIGPLRSFSSGAMSTAFTSVLDTKVINNTWTTQTYAGTKYIYTNAVTQAEDKTIWNGSAPAPGTVKATTVAQFTDAISNFNAAEVSGTYTVELAEGTYPMGDIVITQTSGKHLIITAAEAANVAISYAGSNGYVFKVESNSNYTTDANIQFKGLKFSTGTAYAFTTGDAETRYVNDIDFINCEFTTDAGCTPVTSPSNSQPSGLYFEKCTVTNGSGYLYSGYGNNSSVARNYAVKAVNCTATNCKHFINAQNNGTVIVENCTVSLSSGDYAVRTNAGNITVSNSSFTSTFVSSQATPEVCGLLVVRNGNATVTVDQVTTFSHSQEYIHDVQAADASTTVTIAGRVSASITNTTYDFK